MRKSRIRGSTFTPGLRALPAERRLQTASSPPAPDAPRCRRGWRPLPLAYAPWEGARTAASSWKPTPSGGHHQALPVGAHRTHPRRTAPGIPPTQTGGSQAPPALQGPCGSSDRRGWSWGASPGQQLRWGAGRTEGRQPRSAALATGVGLPSTAAAASGSGSRASCLRRGRLSTAHGPRGSPSGWGAALSVKTGSTDMQPRRRHLRAGHVPDTRGGGACMSMDAALPALAAAWNPRTSPRQHGETGVGERARRWEQCLATTRTWSRGRHTLSRPGTSHLGAFQHGRSERLGS